MSDRLRLDRAALLLIDLQNDFLAPGGVFARRNWYTIARDDLTALVSTCRRLADAFLRGGRPVVWVNTAFRPDYTDCAWASPWHTRVLGEMGGCLVEASWGAALVDGLTLRPTDHVVVKKGHGAFLHTHLDRLLANLNVDHCVIAGGDVPGSISDTVRQGAALGYEQFVVADAVYPPRSPQLPTLRNRAEFLTADDALAHPSITPATAVAPLAPAPPPYALLVVDVQNDFVHADGAQRRYGYSALTDDEATLMIANTRRLIDAMHAGGWPVIFVRDVQTAHGRDTTLPRTIRRVNPMPPEAQFIQEGTWGAAFVDDLQPGEGDLEIVKRGNSAFGFTPLHRTLRNLGVRRCLVTGGAVHGCVSDTVREGAGLGWELTVVADATYPPSSAYLKLLRERATIHTTDEVLQELKIRAHWGSR